jgi:hypothetical protein
MLLLLIPRAPELVTLWSATLSVTNTDSHEKRLILLLLSDLAFHCRIEESWQT